MSLPEFIAGSVNNSTVEVFSTMLGVELAPGHVSLAAAGRWNGGVMSFIGLAGTWAGIGSISMSAQMACRISSLMLMTEYTAVDEDVLDAVAEITNMIVGNVKNDLESQLGPLGLSIPTVVYGGNFQSRTSGTPDWIVISFEMDTELMVVKLCLAPQNGPPTPHMAHGHGIALNV